MSESIKAQIESGLAELKQDPQSKVFAKLSEAYRKSGECEAAIEIAKNGLKYHPTFLNGKIALGRALFEYGELAKAKPLFEEIVYLSPDNIVALRLLSKIYIATQDTQKAIAKLKQLLVLDPDDAISREELTALENRSNKSENAKPTGTPGKMVSPTLAELYESQGYEAEAKKVYEQLSVKNPTDVDIQNKLKSMQGSSGHLASANVLRVKKLKALLEKIQKRGKSL